MIQCNLCYNVTGTFWAFSVLVDVGRSSWPKSKDYVNFLPSLIFTNPADCATGKNKEIVRMFKQGIYYLPICIVLRYINRIEVYEFCSQLKSLTVVS